MKLRRIILGALAGAALVAVATPQGAVAQIWADYTLSIVPRVYQPQTNRGIQIRTQQFVDQYAPGVEDRDNGVAGPIPIGFTFEYNGQLYTQIYVCVNGWLSFQNPGGYLTDDPYSLFNNTRPNLTVAPFFGDHFLRDRVRPPADLDDPKGRPYSQSAIRYVQIPGDSITPAKMIVEWEHLNINYRFDPTQPDNPFAPIDSVRPQASSVGSFQVWLIQAPPGSVSLAGDIEFHYGPVGPPAPFPDTVGTIVKTSSATIGIEDEPAVPNGATNYMNAVAYRESGGRFDSTTQSRRTTRVWPPPGFPGQVFLFSATRLRRLDGWGDGDANLTQLDPAIPVIVRDDQRRFATFLDVIHILRHQATRNVNFDSAVGRHAFHGDVNHNGRFYYSTRNAANNADSLDGSGAVVRYKVFYPVKSVNYQIPQPIDNSFSGFLFDADEFDASLIMLYLAAKLPVLPWLPDTLPHFTGKLAPIPVANDISLSNPRLIGGNRIEIPVTFNGLANGANGFRLDLAEGSRIVEVRTASRTDNAWVEAVASENRLVLAAAGSFRPEDVVATVVVEADGEQVVFSNVRFNEQEKGLRKLPIRNGSTDAGGSLGISQNVPNPFAPMSTTTVDFTVPTESRVTVRVYDVMGNEVKSLASGVMSAGSYTVDWNGTDGTGKAVFSGVYYCRIEAAGQSRAIPMQVSR